MTNNLPYILALLDDRPGNNTQVLGVAQKLAAMTGAEVVEVQLDYNGWIRLPNLLLGASLKALTEESKEMLQAFLSERMNEAFSSSAVTMERGQETSQSQQKIAIAAGRRATPVLRYLKEKQPDCFTVQLMWPGPPTDGLDLIAVPEHDGREKEENVMTTVGAPHRLKPETLDAAAKEWEAEFAQYPEPRIALLVGGSTKHGQFTEKDAVTMAYRVEALVRSTGGSLLISTSRRTDEHILEVLRYHIHVPHHRYEWTPDGPNPYLGLLALADAVIVTGDSIAMASEACGTGKPLFIFEPPTCLPEKHRRFIQTLYQHGCARPLGERYEKWGYIPLDTAKNVADEIVKRFHTVNNDMS